MSTLLELHGSIDDIIITIFLVLHLTFLKDFLGDNILTSFVVSLDLTLLDSMQEPSIFTLSIVISLCLPMVFFFFYIISIVFQFSMKTTALIVYSGQVCVLGRIVRGIHEIGSLFSER